MRILKTIALLTFCVPLFGGIVLWQFGGTLLERYRGEIEAELKERTGLSIEFGKISLSLYPALAISLNEVRAQPSNPECDPIDVGRINLSLSWAPLLRRTFDIRQISIRGIRSSLALSNGALSLATKRGKSCVVTSSVSTVREQKLLTSDASTTTSSALPLARSVKISLEHFDLSDVRVEVSNGRTTHTLDANAANLHLYGTSHDIQLSELTLLGSVDGDNLSLRMKDFTASTDLTEFSVKTLEVGLAGQVATLREAHIEPKAISGSGQIALSGISFSTLRKLIGESFPAHRGLLKADLSISAEHGKIHTLGDISVADLALTFPILTTKNLHFSRFSLEMENGAPQRISGDLEVEGFFADYQDATYRVTSCTGPVSANVGNEVSFAGDLKVKDFGYADSDTQITKVNAELRKISGRMDQRGTVITDVFLDAHSIYLTNSSIIIPSVVHVQAPLVVTVPERGYSVVGPVSIHDGVLVLSDHTLEKSSGTIQIHVANGHKEFHSKDLEATAAGVPITGRTHFLMTDPTYLLDQTTFNLAGSTITPSLTLARTPDHPMNAELSITNLPIPAAYKAAMQKDDSPIQGTISELSVNGHGLFAHLAQTAEATGKVRCDGCVFQTVDLQDFFKRAIASIPLIGDALVPSDTPDSLNAGDLSSSLTVSNGRVSAPDLRVQLSNATIEGKVSVGFDKSLKGHVSIVFLEETFRLLGFGFERLSNFLAREGRIAIPLILGRNVSDPSIRPDLVAIVKSAPGISLIEGAVKDVEEAGEEIEDAL